MTHTVKAKLGDDLRRVTLQPSTDIAQLRSTLCQLFGLAPTQTLKLRYADEEGDLITLSSDVELAEALSSLSSPSATLKLELEVVPLAQNPPSSPSLIPAPSPASPSFFPSFNPSTPFPSTSFTSPPPSEPSPASSSTPVSEELPPPPPAVENEVLFHSAEVFTAEPPREEEEEQEKEEQEKEDRQKGKEAAAEEKEEILPPYHGEGTLPPPEKEDFFSRAYQEERGLDFGFLLNEFHYHRLIVQTACRAGFDSLVKEYEEHHKAKVDEMWSRASTQSTVLAHTIEKTFEEWKKEVSQSPPAQEISNRVSEALKGVESFTAPIIENIRVALLHTLDRIFNDQPPASLTSSELVREMETFHFSTAPLPEKTATPTPTPAPSEPTPVETPLPEDSKVIPPDVHTHEESFTGTVGDVQVPSNLYDGFVYVPEQPEEETPFPYMEALSEIVSMGFEDLLAVRAALVANQGQVEAAVNALLN